jgi:hypothetical protein
MLSEEPSWPSFDAYKNQKAPTTSEDVVDASFELAQLDTGVMLGARMKSVKDLESSGAKMLSPEEANGLYPDMPTPFKEPVNPYVAQMISDRETDKRELERKIQEGPQDAWTKAKSFGAGLLAHLMDPIEFGVGAVTGWGVGGALAKTAWGARLAAQQGASFTARTALQAVEAVSGNTIENTLQEAAVYGVQEGLEGIKYDPVQGMQNIAVSTFFGSLVGGGIKEGSFRLGRFLKGTSPEADLAVLRGMRGQAEAGLKVDPTQVLEQMVRETDVRSENFPNKGSYSYEKLTSESTKGKKFYIASDRVDDLNPDTMRNVGEHRGTGLQLTDNHLVANAAANRSMADAKGGVVEVEFKEGVKLLDLDQPASPDVVEFFRNPLQGIVSDFEDAIANRPVKELLDALWNAADEGAADPMQIYDLEAKLQGAGYGAYVSDGSSVGGVDHAKHNVVTVLDRKHLSVVAANSADPEIKVDVPSDKIREMEAQYNDPKRQAHIDPESLDRLDRESVDAESQAKLQADELADDEAFLAEFDSMREQGLLEEGLAKEVESIREFETKTKLEDTVLKAVMACVRG